DVAAEQRIAGWQWSGAFDGRARGTGEILLIHRGNLAAMLWANLMWRSAHCPYSLGSAAHRKEWPDALRCLGRRHATESNFRLTRGSWSQGGALGDAGRTQSCAA